MEGDDKKVSVFDTINGLGYKDQVRNQSTTNNGEQIAHAELIPSDVAPTSIEFDNGESESTVRAKENKQAKRRALLLFVGVGILVILAATAGSFATTKILARQSATSTSPEVIAEVVVSPTSTPTFSRNMTIQELLSNLYGVGEVPGPEDSPQQLAVRWLLLDQANEESLVSDSRILTRFALAVLYYATRGERWVAQANFVTLGRHECDWNLGATFGTRCDVAGDLTSVSLPNNRLVGTLPTEIGLLTTLNILQLRGSHRNNTNVNVESNALRGTLPTELGNLGQLIQLDVSRTGPLEGTIPTEIGNLQNLVELRLNDNNLTGAIPSVIGDMPSLKFADFDNNYLTEAPENLVNIQCISVSGNNLEACFQEFRRLQASSMGTPKVCFNYRPPCELPES